MAFDVGFGAFVVLSVALVVSVVRYTRRQSREGRGRG